MTAPRFDITLLEREIASLLALCPELAEDESLRSDMIEGETSAYDALTSLVRRIGEAEAMAEGIATYCASLKERKQRLERRAEALRAGILRLMTAADMRKAELAIATLSRTRTAPKVIITDESIIPEDCWRVKSEPDLAIIRDRLRAVGDVPGAVLGNGSESLTIRVK